MTMKVYAIRFSTLQSMPESIMSGIPNEYRLAESAVEALDGAISQLTNDERASLESISCELIGGITKDGLLRRTATSEGRCL